MPELKTLYELSKAMDLFLVRLFVSKEAPTVLISPSMHPSIIKYPALRVDGPFLSCLGGKCCPLIMINRVISSQDTVQKVEHSKVRAHWAFFSRKTLLKREQTARRGIATFKRKHCNQEND